MNKEKKNINETPGTPRYRGKHAGDTMMEMITYNDAQVSRTPLSDFPELDSDSGVTWINVAGLSDIQIIHRLGEKYGVHRIDLEDMVNIVQRSKIETREDYLFSVQKMAYLMDDKVVHEHISFLLVGQTLITLQETPEDVFDPVRRRILENVGQIRKQKADYLYYSLTDCIIDQYFEIMGFVETEFSQAEALIFEGEEKAMEKAYALQKELIYLKNDIFPMQDALSRLIKKESKYISRFVLTYFADVLHNTLQAIDDINTYREMTQSLYEMQVTKTSNEMNKVMMTLTIFSAIFIPLSFLTGVYGMNFKTLPGSGSPYAFYIFGGVCALLVGLMLLFFRRRKWF